MRAGVDADVTELVKALWQDMLDEATEELDGVQADATFAAGAEGDAVRAKREDARVGDGDAVSVTAKIFDDMRGTAERALGVDVPTQSAELAMKPIEGLWIGEVVEALECALRVGAT